MTPLIFQCRRCGKPLATQYDWMIDGREYTLEQLQKNPTIEESAHNRPTQVPATRILLSKRDGGTFTGRLLECGHFVPASQESIPTLIERNDNLAIIDNIISTEELKEIRANLMPTILKMSEDELILHIQQHRADYQNLLKLQKKEKYVVQLIEAEVERRQASGTLSEASKMLYDSVLRSPVRSGEKLAREKVKVNNSAAKKAKAEDDALKMMLTAMQAKGRNITLEELKAKMGGK